MKRIWGIIAASALAGCTSGPTPGKVDVGRAELRPAPVLSAARTAVGDLAAASLGFARTQRTALGLGANDDFAVLRSDVRPDGRDYVRLQQLHEGVKVWGGDIVVHGLGDQVEGVSGNLLGGIKDLDVVPALADDTAMSIAKSNYALAARSARPLTYQREQKELVILPLADGTARLAWHVTFFTDPQAGIGPGLWNYFVDAHSGAIVKSFNGLETEEASGPGGNAKVTRTWNMNLDVTLTNGQYAMNTAQLRTTNMNHKTSGTGTTYTGPSLTNYNQNDPAANDAHGFAEMTVKMLKDWFGYNSIDNQGYKILSRVHYDTNYENAFWDGQQMTYGDGDTYFYEMSGSLDVVAHEIDHGFTSYHSDLTYDGESGGMNESFSDIAGTAAKFYYDAKTATFDLGGDILKPGTPLGTALRYMCDPTKDGSSIDKASDYNGQDVHYSSGVMNKAFCRAAKRLSGVDPDKGNATADGVKKAAKAWFLANEKYWTTSSQWTQGCQGVIDAATKDLQYDAGDVSALGDSWKDVGVTCNYTHVNDFTLSLTPDKQMAMAGTKAEFTVTTGLTAGNTAQPLTLSVSGLPSGATGTFSPSSVQSGANATLTIDLPYDAPQGDVTVTVTAAGGTGGATRTATATLTVTAPPPDMAMIPDMAMAANNGNNGNGNGNNGNGTGGNGLSTGASGCSIGSDATSTAGALLLGLLFVAALFVRRHARVRARR